MCCNMYVRRNIINSVFSSTLCPPPPFPSQDQLQALVRFEAEVQAQQSEMESAEEIHRQTQAALIFDNKHAQVTMEVRGR